MKFRSQKDLLVSFSLIFAIIAVICIVSLYALHRSTGAINMVRQSEEFVQLAQKGSINFGQAGHLLFALLENHGTMQEVQSEVDDLKNEYLAIRKAMKANILSSEQLLMVNDFIKYGDEFYQALDKTIPMKLEIMVYMTDYKGEMRPLYDVLSERELQHNMYVRALEKSVAEKKLLVGTLNVEDCGLFDWYSREGAIRDEDIAEIVFDEVDPYHRKLHKAANLISQYIAAGNIPEAEKVLKTVDEDLGRLSLYLSGVRVLVKERYGKHRRLFYAQVKRLDDLYAEALGVADNLDAFLKNIQLKDALQNLDNVVLRLKFLILFFAIAGLVITCIIASLSITRVQRRTMELQNEVEERRNAETELRQQSEFLRVVVNSLNHPFYVIDANSYEVKMANKASAIDLRKGQSFCYVQTHKFRHPCNGEDHPCPLPRVKKGKKPVIVEHHHYDQNGQLRQEEFHAHPILNSLGEVEAVIEYSIDITSRKQVEKALLEAKDAAEEANRAKSMFLANMSHEIRTPMNGIIGFTDILLQSSLSGDQIRSLGIIKKSAMRLLGTINNILDFSKIEAGKMEIDRTAMNLRELVKDVIGLLKPAAEEKNIVLVHDVAGEIRDSLSGDSTRLQQVLVNLIANAIKFTARGVVEVLVREASRDVQKRYLPRLDSPAAYVVHFSIRDTGIGISDAVQKKIFHAFTQADGTMSRQYGGTGLGLTISSRLVHLMGGAIWLESADDQGSIFHFMIQFDGRALADDARKDSPGNSSGDLPGLPGNAPATVSADLSSKTILIVEDEDINRLLLLDILGETGCRLETAGNGEEALAKFQEHGADLVLMDVQMPKMDGLETTQAIRNLEGTGHVPIIALTAHAMTGDRERFLAAGMDDYVAKPVELRALLATIVKYLQP